MGEYQNSGKQVMFDTGLNKVHIADAADNEKAHFLTTAANAYSDFDYMAEADKTCSVIFNPQNVHRESFFFTLRQIAEFADMLNVHKKLLFRGKSPEELGRNVPKLHESLAVEFDPNNPVPGEIDLLHGIVGVITEAGEMAEVLIHRLESGKFDAVNAFEENGDVLWYVARQLRGLNTDFETLQRANIDKLHGRHGEAFDVFRDANRDLHAEREKLEASAPLFDDRTHGADSAVDDPAPAPAFDGQGRVDDPAPSNVGTAAQRSDPPGVSDYLNRRPAADIPGMDG